MPNASTSFFGWVYFLLQKYGMLFLRGTGMTLLIALTGTALGFVLGLLVAIVRTITLPEKKRGESGVGLTIRRGLLAFVQLLTNIYIQVFRGTPMIVQAVVIYYGAQYRHLYGYDLRRDFHHLHQYRRIYGGDYPRRHRFRGQGSV
ncbi:MAG: hypothetical protein V8Q79_00835 [Christensenellales bacterium]